MPPDTVTLHLAWGAPREGQRTEPYGFVTPEEASAFLWGVYATGRADWDLLTDASVWQRGRWVRLAVAEGV